MSNRPVRFLLPCLLVAACGSAPVSAPVAPPAAAGAPRFPAPDRPVASIISAGWSDEESRDKAGEPEEVFRLAGVRPGQTVADIGAGSGYLTVRLAPVVLPGGRVFATDVIPDYLARLKARVRQAGLGNVTLILGDPDNARLPPASTDIAFMIHMYHEIAEPYALLWHLHESLKPGARLVIADADRKTANHGTPPALLRCELAAVGFRQVGFHRRGAGGYLALFEPVARPAPEAIKPCQE